jgi:hypothetical protein
MSSQEPYELRIRAVAIPLALALAWLAVRVAPPATRMVTMWVHESGHAATAWLCGYVAFPGPWFTPVSGSRSWGVTLLVVAGLGAGARFAWRENEWGWSLAAASTLFLALYCTFALTMFSAEALVTFMGDGGCFVLGSLLMLTIYVPPDHPLRSGGVCWGLLALGALAFADAAHVWSGDVMRIPFGENGNGLSDPSVLTEIHQWTLQTMLRRYGLLKWSCLVGLGVAYAAGLATVNAAIEGTADQRWPAARS